jgi:hypothetical protein
VTLEELLARPAWQKDALCREYSFDWCSDSLPEVARCCQVCSRCLCRVECLEAGRNEMAGVWGGVYRGRGSARALYGPKVIRSRRSA